MIAAGQFIALAAALAGLLILAVRWSRAARLQPMFVIASLVGLMAVSHLLSGLEHLGYEAFDRLVDYCRLISPVLWTFLLYAWLRSRDAQRISASQNQLQAIVEHMPVMVDAFDEQGRIALWNRECERLTGYSAAEVVNNPSIMERLYPDPIYREKMVREWMARVGSYRDWRWRLTCKDGSTRVIAWSNVSDQVRIPPWTWWGVGVDVTDQEKTQSYLMESEARFRAFMDHSPAITFIKDEHGRYIVGNQAWADQFGRPMRELMGRTDDDLWPPENAQAFRLRDRELRRGGKPIHYEETSAGSTGTGTRRWYDVYKFLIPAEDGRQFIGGILIDVTDRKLAAAQIEEWRNRFEAAINSSGQILYDWNAVTNEIVIGGPVGQVLGIAAADLRSLDHWESRIHPDDINAFRAEIHRVTQTREPFNLEYRMRHADGRYVTVEDHGHFFSDAQGKLTRMVGFATDITERKSAQERRQQLESRLVQTQRLEAVGNLAAGIAHDFSNLLTAISGHLALAYRGLPPDHPARRSLGMVEKATLQGIDMTRSLLTFAHKTPSAKQPCDLRRLIRESVQIFRHMLPKTIEIAMDEAESDAPWVQASPSQLQQVLMNLIINARDAMPAGGKLKLGVQLAQHESDNISSAEAVITVEDNGIGMDEQTLPRIFEPFFTTKERHKGTGLGLSVVHGIVTDHGGRIEVASKPGRGTRFQIVLPTCPPGESREDDVRPSEVPAARRRRAVLLMHEQGYVGEIVVTALESAGFTVIAAASPAEATAASRDRADEIGVAVIDADLLPATDESPVPEFHQSLGSPPLIVLTSNTAQFLDEPNVENRTILPKPYQMSQLVESVNKALGLWKPGDP